MKQKGEKVAIEIISHACRNYKSMLVKLWRKKGEPLQYVQRVERRRLGQICCKVRIR
jgi:hypothetical protein